MFVIAVPLSNSWYRTRTQRPSELSRRGDDIAGLHKRRKAEARAISDFKLTGTTYTGRVALRVLETWTCMKPFQRLKRGISALDPRHRHARKSFREWNEASPITAYGRRIVGACSTPKDPYFLAHCSQPCDELR